MAERIDPIKASAEAACAVTVHSGKTKMRVAFSKEKTLLELLRTAGFLMESPCGGNGVCGHCKIRAEGALSPLSEREKEKLTEAEITSGIRLACLTRAAGDCDVFLDEADSLSVVTDAQGSLTLSAGQEGLGVAVDVGTTTVAVYLYDRMNGSLLGTEGFRNPQAAYGFDVISRMQAIMERPDALREQQTLLMNAIGQAVTRLCLQEKEITGYVLCGNTVMEHIAAGFSPVSIATAPFTAPTLFGSSHAASSLGLTAKEGTAVYFAPCFASYVGGDIACGVIAAGLDQTTETVLFLDVGTNGEAALLHKGRLTLCATAAGPAFEGAGISSGMAGTAGAICHVGIENGKIVYETVRDQKAKGICGSGLLDAVACMLETGDLDETGCLDEDWPIGESGIFLTPADIRALQLAKAAIAAGIRTLLHACSLSEKDVDRVCLAGGFGSFLKSHSACRIGLLPSSWEDRIETLGNTAGLGASAVLLDENAKARLEALPAKATYIELSGDPYFSQAYVDEMIFPESD